MHKINRREILGCLAIVPSFSVFGVMPPLEASQCRASCEPTLFAILRVWLSTQNSLPSEYLLREGVDTADAPSIKKRIQKDFREDNLLTINGFLLSKTESALLAALAMLMMNG